MSLRRSVRKSLGLAALATAAVMVHAPPAFAAADLAITKEDSKDPARVGKKLTYKITVTNLGPDTADGVALTDDLPGDPCFPGSPCNPAVEVVSVKAKPGTCGTEAEGFISCDLGNLAPGRRATVTIVVRPLRPGTIVNSAFVGANNEADYANNQASEQTVVVAR